MKQHCNGSNISLNDRNAVIICARDEMQTALERIEEICCKKVSSTSMCSSHDLTPQQF